MGNREALLQAAKICLLEKGYVLTTARDIASKAGVSLAAIGYHFGSKDALLTEALMLAIGDWEQDFHRALQSAIRPKAAPAERFETIWKRLIETFETHRPLWVANFELFAHADRLPDLRRVLGKNMQQARAGLAALFLNVEESSIDEQTANTLGAFYHALLTGLIAQFLIYPKQALSARSLTEAMRRTSAELLPKPGTKNKPAKTARK